MNQTKLLSLNRDAVLRVITARRGAGVSAKRIQAVTMLCLRTVQSHLRALREQGLIHNANGLWHAGPPKESQP